jgi:hypothetical protein
MTPTDTSREKIDLILVSCCGQKLKGTHPAGHIYQSQLFNAAARYAKAAGKQWAILSAKHGVVFPDQVISDYDLTLSKLSADSQLYWRIKVIHQLRARGFAGKSIEVLAGEAYEFCNLDGFDDTVKFPLRGLGIGHRLAWFKSMMHRFYQAADSQLSFSF